MMKIAFLFLAAIVLPTSLSWNSKAKANAKDKISLKRPSRFTKEVVDLLDEMEIFNIHEGKMPTAPPNRGSIRRLKKRPNRRPNGKPNKRPNRRPNRKPDRRPHRIPSIKPTRRPNRRPNTTPYPRTFHKCHIIPFGFIQRMFSENGKDRKMMEEFIKDLAKIHTTAAFYKALHPTVQKKLEGLTVQYETAAITAYENRDEKKLGIALFNMPSNLYPGDPDNNVSIGNNLDPPKEAAQHEGKPPRKKGPGQDIKRRTERADYLATELFQKYHINGLEIKTDGSNHNRAKTSDKTKKEPNGDFVYIL